MTIKHTRRLISKAIGLAALAPLTNALAQTASSTPTYPTKPIRMVVGFTPGGATDISARTIAQKLSERLGQQVVVENKPGASGNIAADHVAKSTPDGYTIMLCSIPTHAINPNLYARLPFDHIKDFAPISLVGMLPNIISVHPDFPASNVAEFVAVLKKNPDKYDYATIAGGSPHLTAEVFKDVAGVNMRLIPYKGSAPAIADVIGGQVPVLVDNVAPSLPHVKSGKLKPIAVTGLTRLPSLPDVPTVAESGYPGFQVEGWVGIVAPANTPDAIVKRLNKEIREILATPETRDRLGQISVVARSSTPEEFGDYIRSQTEFWGKVTRRIGLAGTL